LPGNARRSTIAARIGSPHAIEEIQAIGGSFVNTSRYVLGSLVVFVYFFLIEWLLHGVILSGWYSEAPQLLRSEQAMQAYLLWMILAHLILAFGFCFIFLKGYQGRGCLEGVRYGLYVGIAFSVSVQLMNYAAFPFPGKWVLVWIIVYPIILMIAGAIFAAMYKPKAPTVA
jgi:hypothetical protein